jgi:hypothetical protein
LPEPVAWKAGMAGSKGAAAQQCAAATRLDAIRRQSDEQLLENYE